MAKNWKDEKHDRDRRHAKDSEESVPGSGLETILKELDPRSVDFQIDLEVGDRSGSMDSDTPVDFSVSKDLVPTPTRAVIADTTMSRSLTKMIDSNQLDQARLQEKRIIHPEMDDYLIMNSFREIRTRLLQKSGNKNFVVIVVSIGRSMGATFTAVNLGAAFSYEGEKTALLIDCHTQKGNLSSLLDLQETIGLSDYIDNRDIELSEIIYPTGIKRMRLIPFGSSRSGRMEFLASERMREFMGVLKHRHTDRYIIIDAPPLELSADAAILSEIADYVIVVVPYGKVSNDRLDKAIKSLPAEKIVGIVMNQCKRYV